MAKNDIGNFKTGKKPNYKAVFYAIRGLLSAELASQNIIPELDILNLRNQFAQNNELIDLLENSIDQKRNSNEKEPIALEQRDPILKVLDDYLQKLQNLNISKFGPNPKLETVLKDYNYVVKEQFYLL